MHFALKFAKFVNEIIVGFTSNDIRMALSCLIQFLAKIFATYYKIQLAFFLKLARIKLL